jgi:ABC-2 type transport system ATP-binding protein
MNVIELRDVSRAYRRGEDVLETLDLTVRVLGLDPRVDPEAVKRQVGYVSEDQVLPGFLRVDEAIDLHRQLYPTWDDDLASELA